MRYIVRPEGNKTPVRNEGKYSVGRGGTENHHRVLKLSLGQVFNECDGRCEGGEEGGRGED